MGTTDRRWSYTNPPSLLATLYVQTNQFKQTNAARPNPPQRPWLIGHLRSISTPHFPLIMITNYASSARQKSVYMHMICSPRKGRNMHDPCQDKEELS